MSKYHAVKRLREELDRHRIWLGMEALIENAENGAELTVLYQDGGAMAAHYIINRAVSVKTLRAIIHSNTASKGLEAAPENIL